VRSLFLRILCVGGNEKRGKGARKIVIGKRSVVVPRLFLFVRSHSRDASNDDCGKSWCRTANEGESLGHASMRCRRSATPLDSAVCTRVVVHGNKIPGYTDRRAVVSLFILEVLEREFSMKRDGCFARPDASQEWTRRQPVSHAITVISSDFCIYLNIRIYTKEIKYL